MRLSGVVSFNPHLAQCSGQRLTKGLTVFEENQPVVWKDCCVLLVTGVIQSLEIHGQMNSPVHQDQLATWFMHQTDLQTFINLSVK